MCLGVPVIDNSSCPIRIDMQPARAAGPPPPQPRSRSFASSPSWIRINGSSTEHESALLTMGLMGSEAVEVRAFLDQTFAEVYINQGRATMTGFTVAGGDLGFGLFSGSGYELRSVVAYAMKQAWVP